LFATVEYKNLSKYEFTEKQLTPTESFTRVQWAMWIAMMIPWLRNGRHLNNLQKLSDSLNPDQIFYALKSNSLQPVLEIISGQGCGFQANNMPEMEK